MIKYSNYRKYVQPVILLLIISFFAVYLVKHADDISQILVKIQIGWLPWVILVIITSNLVKAVSWSYLAKTMDNRLSYKHLIAIWHYSLLGGYIPGSIWMMVGRVYQLHKATFPKKKAIYSVGIEQIITLAAAFFVVLLSPDILDYIHIPKEVGWIIAPISLVVLFPRIWGQLIWKIGFRRIDFRLIPKIPLKCLIIYFLGTLTSLFIVGIYVQLVLKLFNINAPQITILSSTSMPTASFIVGYLSFLTPSGLGVKEGIFSMLLSRYIPLTTAVLFAVSGRLWLFLSHLITIPISYLYLQNKTKEFKLKNNPAFCDKMSGQMKNEDKDTE